MHIVLVGYDMRERQASHVSIHDNTPTYTGVLYRVHTCGTPAVVHICFHDYTILSESQSPVPSAFEPLHSSHCCGRI